MHVLVRFDESGIAKRALKNKVQLIDAGAYYLTSSPGNEFVLGFSSLSERAIREGTWSIHMQPAIDREVRSRSEARLIGS
jgi:DNA-binding transcriptional MocR family regulator